MRLCQPARQESDVTITQERSGALPERFNNENKTQLPHIIQRFIVSSTDVWSFKSNVIFKVVIKETFQLTESLETFERLDIGLGVD